MTIQNGSFGRLVAGELPSINHAARPAITPKKSSAIATPKASQDTPLRFGHLKSGAVIAPPAPAPVRLTKANEASLLASQMISAARKYRSLISDPIVADRPAQPVAIPDPNIEAAAKDIAAKMVAHAGRGVRL